MRVHSSTDDSETLLDPYLSIIIHLSIYHQSIISHLSIYLSSINLPIICLSINQLSIYLSVYHLSISSSSLRIWWKVGQKDRLKFKTSSKLTICSFIQQTFIRFQVLCWALRDTDVESMFMTLSNLVCGF